MFSNWFLKSFRILLLPFALVYGLVVWVRNYLYNKKVLRSSSFGLPLICVGNLSVGGTGKSPMVEWLVKRLKDEYRVATLSRGYKRKTKGYALAHERSTALEIGDEPMLFHQKFPDVPVAVGEERIVAIPQLLHDHPETEVIILDDAFQHRAIQPGYSVLLTDYGNLFTRDFFLPTGDLRDLPGSYKRAQDIIVTKCPADLSEEEAKAIESEIGPLPRQRVFFTTIAYGSPYHLVTKAPVQLEADTEVLLITGIANPRPLKEWLEQKIDSYQMMHFNDHHIFTIDDWKDMVKRYESMEQGRAILLTTEKDAMRLMKFSAEVNGMPFYVIPIEHHFLFSQEPVFTERISSFIRNFKLTV